MIIGGTGGAGIDEGVCTIVDGVCTIVVEVAAGKNGVADVDGMKISSREALLLGISIDWFFFGLPLFLLG